MFTRRNIFTSYIICNCLNLKTFFKPIIYFIARYVTGPTHLGEPYMKISSHAAQTDKHKLKKDSKLQQAQ